MGLELDITPQAIVQAGRKVAPLAGEIVRELQAEDLVRIGTTEQGSAPSQLSRISDRHHALAKVLAAGISPAEASIITGYSSSRISILKTDPSFQELLSFYSEDRKLAEAQVLDRVSNMTLTAVSLLEDRMENDPDAIRTSELLQIATAGLDRTGHGPSSKVNVTNLTLTPDDMERLAKASQESNVTVLHARAKDNGAGPSIIEGNFSVGEADPPRVESQGDQVRETNRSGTPSQVSGTGDSLRAVDSVHGRVGDEQLSAGPLHSVPAAGAGDRVQTETKHSGE